MTYTAAEILLFIAAIGGILVSLLQVWKTGKTTEQTLIKAAVIEGHVNSKETKYVEQISSLTRENEILRSVIVEKDKIAALLAQSAATSNQSTPSSNQVKTNEPVILSKV